MNGMIVLVVNLTIILFFVLLNKMYKMLESIGDGIDYKGMTSEEYWNQTNGIDM